VLDNLKIKNDILATKLYRDSLACSLAVAMAAVAYLKKFAPVHLGTTSDG
jgi:hypothetical protein